ncbi:MAG: hypothetical protein J6S62_03330 [Bacteroidales bacterium]|nr:hypothetical protein [Bacteroidales bacterium]MBO7643979.1 hypothetical protein [Bacteroidales bacterium]
MKWLHNLLKGASLTTALFIFQACYGMPQNAMLDEYGEAPMTFLVHSKATGAPVEGVLVQGSSNENGGMAYRNLGVTDSNGVCKVNIPYYRNVRGPWLRFEDPSGNYAVKDTVLYDLRERDIEIDLNQL